MTACVIQVLHFVIKSLLHTVNRYGCKKQQLVALSLANWGELMLTDPSAGWKISCGIFVKSELVLVISFNSHDTTFASWHIFTCHNALCLFRNSHDTKFRVVAPSLMPQHVVVSFSAQWAFSIFERNIYTKDGNYSHVFSNVALCSTWFYSYTYSTYVPLRDFYDLHD
jgi:hypothetical protein